MMELAWGIGCGEKVILPYVPADTLYEGKKIVTQSKQSSRSICHNIHFFSPSASKTPRQHPTAGKVLFSGRLLKAC
jgi:hypothetical protein